MLRILKERLRRWANNIPFYVPWSSAIGLRFEDGRDLEFTVVTTPEFISYEGKIFQLNPETDVYYEIVATPLESIDRELIMIAEEERMLAEAEKYRFPQEPTAEDLKRLKSYFEGDREPDSDIVAGVPTEVHRIVINAAPDADPEALACSIRDFNQDLDKFIGDVKQGGKRDI